MDCKFNFIDVREPLLHPNQKAKHPQSQAPTLYRQFLTVIKAFIRGLLDAHVRSQSTPENRQTYSASKNEQMSPKKSMGRSGSMSKIDNPESTAVSGLNMRASHIPSYSVANTQLLIQRKNLQQKIRFLQQSIAREKRLLSKAQINIRKNENGIDRKSNNITQHLNLHSSRLNDNILQTRQNKHMFHQHLTELLHQNNQKRQQIQNEKRNVRELQARCGNLKVAVLGEQKERGMVKAELIKEQKVMTSLSIEQIELEAERANLLLEVNRYVAGNKLEN